MKKKIAKNIGLSLIFIYFFLLSIKLMSTSFKMFGGDFAESIVLFTSNPFVALFIGILATSMVQSSSFVTSIVVGLVASGCLTLTGAIPIVLGANIGTTITNAIVSITHISKKKEFKHAFEAAILHDIHNTIAVLIFFPLEITFHFLEKSSLFIINLFFKSPDIASNLAFSSPLNFILHPSVAFFTHILVNPIILAIVSLAMLFASMGCFVNILKPLAKTEFREILHKSIFKSPKRSFIFGVCLTAIIQSSSVTTSLIVPFVGTGMLSLEAIYPYLIGANIGTTITALLAALALGSSAALAVAMTHCLFNVFSSMLIYPIRSIPIFISRKIGDTALTSRIIPLIYVITIFFLIPFLIIFV
ncbi:MAG: Na/Pi symporter [Candidatus Aenigmarchaeota archaeon]|nr:Na/Pi symporter [Candidatus Aenigmarchaeota archaeon]